MFLNIYHDVADRLIMSKEIAMQQSAWDQSSRNNKKRFTEPLDDGKVPRKPNQKTIEDTASAYVNEEETTIEIRCACGTLSGEEYTGFSCDLCKTVVKPRFVVFGNRVVPQKFVRQSTQNNSDTPTNVEEPIDAESEVKDASMSNSVNGNDSTTDGNDEKAKVVVHVHNDKASPSSKVGLVVSICALLTCGAILGAAWYLKR